MKGVGLFSGTERYHNLTNIIVSPMTMTESVRRQTKADLMEIKEEFIITGSFVYSAIRYDSDT